MDRCERRVGGDTRHEQEVEGFASIQTVKLVSAVACARRSGGDIDRDVNIVCSIPYVQATSSPVQTSAPPRAFIFGLLIR